LWLAVLLLQVVVLFAAAVAPKFGWRLLLICRYYVLMTAAIAGGFWDWSRHGTQAGWEPPEGTR
jgi:hypothetical protein